MENETQIVTPWEVSCDAEKGVNYSRIIEKFGCSEINEESLIHFANKPIHHLLKRKLVFAHRDLNTALSSKFYLYTGRGPSADSMHLGHAIPFIFTKYLQDTFDVPLIIQITDDEKCLFTDKSIEETQVYALNNIKDIIAFNFSKKTFIFSNYNYSHNFRKNVLRISKSINLNEAQKVFGFDLNSSIGQIHFPAYEIAPAFSSSFPFLKNYSNCLIPAAIDQDPYFRLARDKAHLLNEPKPSSIYSKFLPSLKGIGKKMSSSDTTSCILLSDNHLDIKAKIMKYAFSGGKTTLKEHREQGGTTFNDIPYIYLSYLMDDCDKLARIKTDYESGVLLTAEIKEMCANEAIRFVMDYQVSRREVDNSTVERFMSVEGVFD